MSAGWSNFFMVDIISNIKDPSHHAPFLNSWLFDLGLVAFLFRLGCLCGVKWLLRPLGSEALWVSYHLNHQMKSSQVSIWVVVEDFLGTERAAGSRIQEELGPCSLVSSIPVWSVGSRCWEADYFTDGTDCSTRIHNVLFQQWCKWCYEQLLFLFISL